jgi:hypothetical protein
MVLKYLSSNEFDELSRLTDSCVFLSQFIIIIIIIIIFTIT